MNYHQRHEPKSRTERNWQRKRRLFLIGNQVDTRMAIHNLIRIQQELFTRRVVSDPCLIVAVPGSISGNDVELSHGQLPDFPCLDLAIQLNNVDTATSIRVSILSPLAQDNRRDNNPEK